MIKWVLNVWVNDKSSGFKMCDVIFCCIEMLMLECFGYGNNLMYIIKFVSCFKEDY